MLDSAKDFLKKRAEQLNLGRGDDLRRIQAILDVLYPDLTHAVSLDGQTLKITTASASAASELRLRQVGLMGKFNGEMPEGRQVSRLHIQIRG